MKQFPNLFANNRDEEWKCSRNHVDFYRITIYGNLEGVEMRVIHMIYEKYLKYIKTM